MNRFNSHNFKILVTLSVLFILSLARIPFSSLAQAPAQERKYEARTFKNTPLIVHEVRNLQKAEHWFRDLEIEVKNISKKPVYFIALGVRFPKIPPSPDMPPENTEVGFTLLYGRPELGRLTNLAGPEDRPIKPGETYIFTIPEGYVEGLKFMEQTQSLPPEATSKIVLHFDTISFGDGTGFVGGGTGGLRDFRG